MRSELGARGSDERYPGRHQGLQRDTGMRVTICARVPARGLGRGACPLDLGLCKFGWHAERIWGPFTHGGLTAWVPKQPAQRAPRENATALPKDHQGPTQTTRVRYRESGRIPESDPDSAEHRYREHRGPTQEARECRKPTQRAPAGARSRLK